METIPMRTSAVALVFLTFCLSPGCRFNDDPLPGTGPRARTAPGLVGFDSCAALETALKENLREEMRAYLQTSRGYYWFDTGGGEEAPTSGDDGGGDRLSEGADYSGTNNQEAGVDESDFVKTDGTSVYLLHGDELVILDVPAPGQLSAGATLDIEGSTGEMLVYKDNETGRAVQAVVFSTVYTWDLDETHPLYEHVGGGNAVDGYSRTSSLTKITVVDLTDPAAPVITDELYLEGYFQTARLVDTSVRIMGYSWIDVPGLTYYPDLPREYYALPDNSTVRDQIWEEAVARAIAQNDALIDSLTLDDLVPAMFRVTGDGSVARRDCTEDACSGFVISADGTSRGFTAILSFDLLAPEGSIDADHIVSNWSTIYSSAGTLVIAEPANDWWWYYGADDVFEEATNIHCFDISGHGQAAYTGSGRVSGTIQDQFSLSEYAGYIRVAATTGQWNRWWLEDTHEEANYVYVLAPDNESLAVVGTVGPIAPGERIWSSRFVKDQCFLVTFRNIDPLWTIDLSDPENPAIKGELEVPGVSTYIHPLENDFLLTIGYEGDEAGLLGGIQVSLFDVSDFANARLVDSLSLAAPAGEGWESWGSSEALWEHKAFQYWAPRNLLAVPLSTWRCAIDPGPDFYLCEYLCALRLISVDPARGLSVHGDIDHSDFYNTDNETYYWCGLDIRRSIFMGDYIYAVGGRAVTADNLDTMSRTAAVELPDNGCGIYYADDGGEVTEKEPEGTVSAAR